MWWRSTGRRARSCSVVQVGTDRVDQKVVHELIETKVPPILADLPQQGQGWRVYYAVFARAGARVAAGEALTSQRGLLVDLKRLYQDLAAE